mmetsp:Transcript_1688/g.2413  ORF Transcript_1688/g.2413 Transcript_1688/m.2413 type:complete len:85 (-) Transcript_1688:152-406(-)
MLLELFISQQPRRSWVAPLPILKKHLTFPSQVVKRHEENPCLWRAPYVHIDARASTWRDRSKGNESGTAQGGDDESKTCPACTT